MSAPSPEKKSNWFYLKRVFAFVQPYQSRFWLSLGLALFMAFASPIRPYLIQLTVNLAVRPDTYVPDWVKWVSFLQPGAGLASWLLAITLFQVGFILVETAVRFLFSFLTAWVGQQVVNDLRTRVYAKIMGLNLRQFDQTPIGTLTTRTINDIESINDIFSDGLIPILADLLTILVTLVTMFWMDWKLTLIALAPFPFMMVATYYFKESVNKSFIQVRNAVAALNAFVQEHLTGMALVQAFAAEDREYKAFQKINRQHRDANVRAIFAYSVFFPVVEVVLAISMGILVWWVADRSLNAGLLVAFILYLNQIFRPLRVIADKFNVLQMGLIAAERVFKVLDIQDQLPPDPPHAHSPTTWKGEIAFENVWFAYTEEQWVLKNLSFVARPGQTLALVGHTGSGKTSVISLLNRLYVHQKGKIRIDGVATEDFSVQALRKGIGVVLQDVFLFSGSILDNITLRNPAISRAAAEQAATLMGLHDFILNLPGGYDYAVMERGATLSLGQRQLISFARALLYNPAILVLDEATSSVDSTSEVLIEKAIETLVKGRTAVVIAHRLSTIRKADQILVLDRGELVEQGTHESLLAQGGRYAAFCEMQFSKKKALLG
ncbi:MAG: ABC transporter ATP-binding protein [Sphingobacteriia bacterium]|nr:MAG: ABC transporter ATP-binding protein [Sphingobacteriia bacterium]